MSQINSDEFKKRAELLKVAKQILIQDYDAMRGTNHQQWLRESQVAWKTKGVLIAYPTAKLFPTEQEVVAKALELYNNLNQPIENTTITPTTTPASAPATPAIEVTEYREPVSYQDAMPVSITEQLQAAYNSHSQPSIIDTGGITEMPPTVPTITRIVQAGGDFVITHDPINLDSIGLIEEPVVTEPIVEEPVVTEPVTEESIGTAPAKHSLLRSVLSGWLAKEKDKS